MVSVIIPVYNAGEYLSPCLDSVLGSSYPHFELILVNDGSTDGSLAVCEEYAARDSRIRLFSQENGGVSSARNKGIDESQGEWLIFIDADDLISPDFLGLVAREGLQSADFLLFDFITAAEGQLDTGAPIPEGIFFSGKQMRQLLQRALMPRQLTEKGNANFLSPWARAYKKSIIDRYLIRFAPDIFFGEDRLFNLEYQMRAGSCRYLPHPVYFYRFQGGSLSHRFIPGRLQNQEKLLQSIRSALEAGLMLPRLEKEFYAYTLYSLTDMLVLDIFHPSNKAPYPQKREACQRLRSSALYREAIRRQKSRESPARRAIQLLFRMKQYRAAGLLCRIGFWYLKLKNQRLAAASGE